jgi:RNA polymerase sigma-70 factor (ECF subfamily)
MVTNEEFEAITTELRPLLIRRAAGLMPSFGDAEDIVQHALAECYALLGEYSDDKSKLGTWITMVVHRRAVDAFRNQANRQRLEGSPPGFDDTVEQDPNVRRAQRKLALAQSEPRESSYDPGYENAVDLKTALLQLPPFLRQVVLAIYVEGYSAPEYAAKLNVSVGKIRCALETGLAALRMHLGVTLEKEEKEDRAVYA